MSEPYLSEIEARLDAFRYRINQLEQGVRMLTQQLARAWQQGGEGGGGEGVKLYWAVSDGAAAGSGTWPSLAYGSFTSDVYDSSMALVASGETVYWLYPDALATAGALVPCLKVGESYIGLLESCTAVA